MPQEALIRKKFYSILLYLWWHCFVYKQYVYKKFNSIYLHTPNLLVFFLSFEQSIKFCLDCRRINLRNVTDGECVFQLSIYKWTQNSKGSHVQVRTYVMIKRFKRKWKYSKVVLIFFRKSRLRFFIRHVHVALGGLTELPRSWIAILQPLGQFMVNWKKYIFLKSDDSYKYICTVWYRPNQLKLYAGNEN